MNVLIMTVLIMTVLIMTVLIMNVLVMTVLLFIAKVKPVQGKALIFFPSFQDGTMDDRTLHCGRYFKFLLQYLHMAIYARYNILAADTFATRFIFITSNV